MPVATEIGKISVKTETSPSSTISSGSRKRPLSSGDRASNPSWQQNISETRLHIGGLGRPRSRFSSVRSSIFFKHHFIAIGFIRSGSYIKRAYLYTTLTEPAQNLYFKAQVPIRPQTFWELTNFYVFKALPKIIFQTSEIFNKMAKGSRQFFSLL